jgi:ribose transport system ATP-binding protein
LEFITTLGFLSKKKEIKLAEKYVGQLHIKTPSVQQLTKNLSGGNQQKIVLAKWLEKNPALLLLDEPTRGIDVKAKNEIYQIMEELAGKGMGIIMVSSELSEIVTVANRVLVMANGTITANLPVADASEDKLLKAAIASN